MEASTEYSEIPKYVQNDRYCDLAAFFKIWFSDIKETEQPTNVIELNVYTQPFLHLIFHLCTFLG